MASRWPVYFDLFAASRRRFALIRLGPGNSQDAFLNITKRVRGRWYYYIIESLLCTQLLFLIDAFA